MEIYRTAYPNELMHHGILGQKWGKKNGPPYPLDYSDHSAAEKKLMSDSKHWAKMDAKNRKAISRSAEVAEKRLEKKYNKAADRLSADQSNLKKQKAYDKATDKYLNQKQLADELRAYADSISEAEWNKVYDGTYSKSTIRARNFAEAFGQMGLGYAHFIGKDRFDLITASGGRNNDLTKEERSLMKDKAKKVAAEIRRDSEPDLRNWIATPGTKKYNDSIHKMSSSEIDAAVKKSLESGMFDMEFLERNLDLDQDGNPLKESELKKSYAKFLKEEYGE